MKIYEIKRNNGSFYEDKKIIYVKARDIKEAIEKGIKAFNKRDREETTDEKNITKAELELEYKDYTYT